MKKRMSIALAAMLTMTLQTAWRAETVAATRVDKAALSDEKAGANWLSYGRTYSEQRFSPLTQVTAENVGDLGVAWYMDLPGHKSLLSTPLVVDGIMYFTGSFATVFAVDTRTGKQLWEYDPKVIEAAGDRGRVMWDSNRGAAYWKGKVFVATGDGRLNAIDAATGKEVWSVMTVDPKLAFFINGAPRVFNDKVIIGNGGTEWGGLRGYVTAYDSETGKQAWRFYTVPGNPADGFEDDAQAMAAKTWHGKWWEHGGGGTVWNGITYDPEFNRIYIGTGNGSPWNQKMRSPGGGDNLFLCSIVALDADTGKYVWHYQTTPGEAWDYNSNMDMVLADLRIDDKPVKALMHAPKNGFFYVIDRATGKLLSAEKIGKVTWASRIDLATGRPVEDPKARYADGEALVWPGPLGVHNWHAMSYNPLTGLVYIPKHDMPALYTDKTIKQPENWKSPSFAFDPGVDLLREDLPIKIDAASLLAWDPVKQQKAWEQKLPGAWNGGTLTTAGNLVFQGRTDGKLVAYRATDGVPLWMFDMGVGISAPPVTYEVDGKQYVALLAGWGGAAASMVGAITAQHGWGYGVHPRRLVVFALDADTKLPKAPPPTFAQPLVQSDFKVDELKAETGSFLFSRNCASCHGGGAVAGGYAPDLRASQAPLYPEAFKEIVVGGSRRLQGMPQFKELSAADLDAIHHYIRRQARKSTAAAQGAR